MKSFTAHTVTCPKSFVTCPICQSLVKDLDAHRAEPETKDGHLQFLEKKVTDLEKSRKTDDIVNILADEVVSRDKVVKKLEGDLAKANASMSALSSKCGDIVKKLDSDEATTGKTLNTLEGNLATANASLSSLGSKVNEMQRPFHFHSENRFAYVWKVRNFDTFLRVPLAVPAARLPASRRGLQDYPNKEEGRSRTSPHFILGGVGPFCLELIHEDHGLKCDFNSDIVSEELAIEGTVKLYKPESIRPEACSTTPLQCLSFEFPKDVLKPDWRVGWKNFVAKEDVANSKTVWIVAELTKVATVGTTES